MAELDPLVLEIMWSRLISVVEEQAAALMRTSFTPIVRDSGDLSAGVFDAEGNMIAQAVTGTPGHINSMATALRHFVREYPPEKLAPGDVLITNDPWKTSGQLHDLTVATPIFKGKRLVAWFASTCHAIDIGGISLSASGREVFEEGLFIPIMKLYEAGQPNETLMSIIRSNVRAPKEVLGDIHAQVVGNEVGGRRLLEFMDEFGLEDLEAVAGEIVSRSEAAMRRAIAGLPDGTYENETFSDGLDEPVCIRCAVTIDGDEIRVDYSGSSSQSPYGINVVMNYTHAYTTYAIKCAVSPDVPNNEGSFRPVKVWAPEGSILNARYPAAVAARHVVGHFLPSAVFGALAQVVPDRVVAEGAGTIWLTQVRGTDRGGRRFIAVFFAAGGMGARPDRDGLSTTSFPSGLMGTPVEVIESGSPLIIREKIWRPDSGGPGKYRGGLGQRITVQVDTDEAYAVSTSMDRQKFPARGYAGGGPGAPARFVAGAEGMIDAKRQVTLPAGSQFTLELPGGGGFFDPLERDPKAVLADVRDGLVSRQRAEEDYGVVIGEDLSLDWVATAALREARRGLTKTTTG
jgi:N-methylhydantoinase B